ncbi:hypothetical protein BRADI_1g54252v3 [Brachypodium distachyon]|uniref:Uncharacterized protein n=1 Tax=Brachypodium distachyon TaxID=15368 RepID=A0A0Q3LBA3_BRADI|nr:hypothetical protein BRADI_1g54252v3 [Brachypodium distachyon]
MFDWGSMICLMDLDLTCFFQEIPACLQVDAEDLILCLDRHTAKLGTIMDHNLDLLIPLMSVTFSTFTEAYKLHTCA